MKLKPKPYQQSMTIGIAVFGAIATICGFIAMVCAAALRLGMFVFGNHQFSITDDSSKLCGVIAGIIFGLALVLWIKVPYVVVSTTEHKQS